MKSLIFCVYLSLFVCAYALEREYFCRTSETITNKSFVLVTRPTASAEYYQPIWTCVFKVSTRSNGFFLLNVSNNDLVDHEPTMDITTLSASPVLSWSWNNPLPDTHKQIIVPSDQGLLVTFKTSQTYEDSRRGAGVTLKVSFFSKEECPPDWYPVGSNCVGFGFRGEKYSYRSAQSVCNLLHANLYEGAQGFDFFSNYTSISAIKNYWIGVNDVKDKGVYRTLSGNKFALANKISCSQAASTAGTSTGACSAVASCVYVKLAGDSPRFLLDDCPNTQDYLCSMPLGGTQTFNLVPDYDSEPLGTMVIVIIVLVLLGIVTAITIVITVLYFKLWRNKSSSENNAVEEPFLNNDNNHRVLRMQSAPA